MSPRATPEPRLALELAPPLHVPARFLATAPAFAIAAGVLLAWEAPAALSSRWSPGALAAVHLFGAGFLGLVMLGAAQQMLPVACAAPLRRPVLIATLVHGLWTAGVVALALALRTQPRPWAIIAGACLLAAALIFSVSALDALWRSRRRGPTPAGFALAAAGLLLTALLGAMLAAGHAGVTPLLRPTVTNAHLGWALAGWIGMLVLAASWRVVPMLQGTPPYPPLLRRVAGPLVAALLVTLTAATLLDADADADADAVATVAIVAEGALLATFAVFAIATLALQRRRVRTPGDPTVTCFRASSVSLLTACALRGASLAGAPGGERLDMAAALAWLAGFAGCAVAGMLLKVAGFVGWLHLHRRAAADPGSVEVLDMKQLVPIRWGAAVAWTHVIAAALLVASPAAPALLGRLGGLALTLAAGLLALTLARAASAIRRASRSPSLRGEPPQSASAPAR